MFIYSVTNCFRFERISMDEIMVNFFKVVKPEKNSQY